MRGALAAWTFAALACTVAAGGTFVDDRGRAVALTRPATRIVTLAPNLTELVFAAGAGDKLVAVSSYSDWPEAAKRLPVVANNGRVDLERLLLAKPDLVLAWQSGNPAAEIARVERLGFPVVSGEIRALGDIPRWLRAIGVLAGTSPTAEAAAQAFERDVAALEAQYAGRAKLAVFYEIWHTPLMTVNGAHLVSRMLDFCGGENVFAAAPLLTPAVSREQLLVAQPAAILVSAPPGLAQRSIASWSGSPELDAVRAGRLYVVDPGVLNRMGPRVTDGIRALCGTLDQARAAMSTAASSSVSQTSEPSRR